MLGDNSTNATVYRPYQMSVRDFKLSLMEYGEYVANKQILLYVPPILLVVGTFGNIFSFYILLKSTKSATNASTYSYLSVLALMDLLVLYIGLLRLWIGQFMIDIEDTNIVLCKVVKFLGYVCSDASVWLIVAMTIERAIVVTFPLKATRICNTKYSRMCIVGICVIFVFVNCHFLWSLELTHYTFNDTVIAECEATVSYKMLVEDIWPWVDAALYSLLPSLIIIVLNCIIIKNVISAKNARNVLRQESTLFRRNCLLSTQSRNREQVSRKITLMLLAISFTFLVTTLPMNIGLIYTSVLGVPDDNASLVKTQLVNTIAEMLMYTNHSINFFLYCATGKKFRSHFKTFICYCCIWRQSNSYSYSTRLVKINITKSDFLDCEQKYYRASTL